MKHLDQHRSGVRPTVEDVAIEFECLVTRVVAVANIELGSPFQLHIGEKLDGSGVCFRDVIDLVCE